MRLCLMATACWAWPTVNQRNSNAPTKLFRKEIYVATAHWFVVPAKSELTDNRGRKEVKKGSYLPLIWPGVQLGSHLIAGPPLKILLYREHSQADKSYYFEPCRNPDFSSSALSDQSQFHSLMYEARRIFNIQFLQQVGTVVFYRALAEAKVISNLLAAVI
jgi:hypothetical protein